MKEVIVVMRKNEVKKTLKTVEIKPDRIRKNEFLDRIYEPDFSIRSFVKSQFFFIKGYVWLMSGLLFLLLLIMIGNAKCQEQIWPVSAMMPFCMLILTNEMNRSAKHRMHEFDGNPVFCKGSTYGKSADHRIGTAWNLTFHDSYCMCKS